MTKAKHTPGPWRLEADPAHFDSLTTVTGGQRMNARPHAWPAYPLTVQVGGMATLHEMQANAALLAAAPELLEALLVAHKRITEDRASYVWGAELPDGSMDTKDAAILHEAYDSKLAQIEAAIAKATGGAA